MSNKWKLIIAVIAFGGLVNMCSSQNTTETTPKPTATQIGRASCRERV